MKIWSEAWQRFFAIMAKEFIQMRRDRLTFGMMIGIPLLQLIIFGFAINSNPKHLPTAVFAGENSSFARSLIYAMKNSEYFSIVQNVPTAAEAEKLLERGDVQFVLHIPENFSRSLVRGESPHVLLEADATDPAVTSNAISAMRALMASVWQREIKGSLSSLEKTPDPAVLDVHAKYNPEGITQYNIVPGLMGVVLNMTMVIITSLAITRERERGTMEMLLSTPAKPIEVMVGKIIPYILVGYIQVGLILFMAKMIFRVPFAGSVILLLLASLVFIAATLAVGITFSTLAKNQLQAVQMSFFFFLPSILLSGFMFPFRGMPEWAQALGSCLPLTHFLRVVRGILLKGNGIFETTRHLIPIFIFLFVVILIGMKRYRRTLD
ncbi:MAG: ABC transporter permease [Verrucomicrobiota bacterium]